MSAIGKVWAQTISRGTVILSGSANLDVNADGASVDGYDAYGEGFTVSVIADGEVEVTPRQLPSRILFASGVVATSPDAMTLGTQYDVVWEAQSASDADVFDNSKIKFHILDKSTALHAKPKPNERFAFLIIVQHGKQ